MAEPKFMLEMKGISKEFPGVKALDGVTLQVRPGTVHALMGENGAGKSTLMKCLFGIYKPDGGEIFIKGQKAEIGNSSDALKLGVSMIHQELHPVPFRNVMENIWLGRFPRIGWGPFQFIDHKKMYKDTEELFKQLDIDLQPDTIVGKLSVSKVQSIEIAKAVSFNSQIIVMDEPTSSLTSVEVEHLFRIINDLKSRGVAIIYISHKMEEILRISDDVTIMRDGKKIGTWPAAEMTTDLIISKMVGRDLTQRFPDRHNVPNGVVMKVENLTSIDPRSFKDVSFELRKGEILGIGGLVGAQRTELIEALFGLREIKSGTISINGKQVKIRSAGEAKKHGLALLTEERRTTGIFPVLSVHENGAIANLRRYVKPYGLLDERRKKTEVNQMVEKLRTKTPSSKTLIMNLSGGNQQKVLLARWLLTEPDILLLDEPTRGIDVGAKYEIYTIIADLAQQGKSIIMISSEMPELLGMSDRVMVMSEGRLTGILDGYKATEQEVMRLAAQH
ncbi:sugar ABC transporter ATP-binding protein [Paenibacillus macerans]|uniref:Ribose/galactose/methyl galactoside import ATP-binding protein n=1 Tax=Paenibacillus macerans TaxID=44252 RepID=A0A090Y9H7_PAEMA|nr:sugar ABC transporter ATP-binding protein [Paenibacillus macerans]KFM95438.1 galactose/methyl galactoside import ATP-binding protein MglA [Paenibacillus macerans]MBS5915084.1 sugar ABC transporter ATP-binding protein [Paenibacillus macerans]MCY7561378.1 sugar ABC transporter ATP-binding protein [Paenibacillus macerans]MEC0140811.1 sugar ABC transporter ATP-binding protein [Paenibacillus macerans]MEC0154414.1 sugar ABC transporter ATP-binding protein [Paenibacillus macerans]